MDPYAGLQKYLHWINMDIVGYTQNITAGYHQRYVSGILNFDKIGYEGYLLDTAAAQAPAVVAVAGGIGGGSSIDNILQQNTDSIISIHCCGSVVQAAAHYP
jgi:hypothetical protein